MLVSNIHILREFCPSEDAARESAKLGKENNGAHADSRPTVSEQVVVDHRHM